MPSQSEIILNKFFFIWRLVGIWPHPTDGVWYKLYGHTVHATMLFLIAGMCMSVPEATTHQELSNSILWMMAFSMLFFKCACVMRTRHRCEELIGLLGQLERTSTGSEYEQFYLARPRVVATRLVTVMVTNAVSCVLLVYVYVVIQSESVLVWQTIHPFNWNRHPVLYLIICTAQFLTAVAYHFVNSTINNYGPVMFMQLSAHLDVLGMRLVRLGYDKKTLAVSAVKANSVRANFVGRQLEVELIECIEYHKLCLR